MTLFQSISIVFKRYAVFKGRASRSEFWWWQLFVVILVAISAVLESCALENTYGIITALIYLILYLPSCAVSVRRCHDSGHSGWWLICPIVGVVMMLLPSQQNDNDYGSSVDGIANANRIIEKIFAGFCYSLFLPIFLLFLIVIGMIYASTPVKLSIDEVPYSTTEQLRELSGMSFLPDIKFEEGVRSNWDNQTYYYFEWVQPLTEQDKQRILKFAKKSRYQQLWVYPEANSNTIVEQKVLSANETPFKICYFEEGIKLESVQTCSGMFEDDIKGLKYNTIWQEYVSVGLSDHTMYFDLQLQESYFTLLNQLKENGYEVTKETKQEILLNKEENYNAYYSVKINKNNNVVSIEYVDW